MEKNIVVVVREGLALRNDNNAAITFNSVSSVESVLYAVKSTLEAIQTNAQGLEPEFTHLYVPSLIGGLLNNLVGLYKRTGKTREGNIIGQTELALYIEVNDMLRDRSDNIRLVNLKHIRKNDLNMETLIKKTWALLDREERKLLTQARAGIAPQVQSQGINPDVQAMQQQNAAMMQMMQQFMAMMGNNNMQMPAQENIVAQPETIMQPEGIKIDIDPNAIQGIQTNSIEGYNPEF